MQALRELAQKAAQNPEIHDSVMNWAEKKDAEAAGTASSPVDLASLQKMVSNVAPMAAAATAPKVSVDAAQAFALLVQAGLSKEVAAANTGVVLPPEPATGGSRHKTKRRKNKKRKHGPRAKSQRVYRAAGHV